jgi:TatD DNase family protein
MYKFIETHCHLDYLKKMGLDEILAESKNVGIEKIITIAVDPDNLDAVLNLANNYEQIYCSQGIHPHDARLCSDDHLELIKKRCLEEKKVVAVGEIGLDFHYNNSPKEIQIDIFRKHLQIAVEVNLPVVIHTRDADEDTKLILKEFSGKLPKGGVIHSFTAGMELARFALDEGFHLGFNGIITFKKADEVRDIVKICPINRILFETDAPFLTPVPHRGKENAPFYLPHVAAQIAVIKGISEQKLNEQVYQNSIGLFSL